VSAENHYLVIATGEGYGSEIASGNNLVDVIACMFYDRTEDMPHEEREAWVRDLADEDQWANDFNLGRVHFSANVGDMYQIDVYLIVDLRCVGAIPTNLEFNDPAPECPFQHLMHADSAGENPTHVFGKVPKP
jgi:hypothetical protein